MYINKLGTYPVQLNFSCNHGVNELTNLKKFKKFTHVLTASGPTYCSKYEKIDTFTAKKTKVTTL
jgi:hypothetical protein